MGNTAKYQNLDHLVKSGGGTWYLTGVQDGDADWRISNGQLALKPGASISNAKRVIIGDGTDDQLVSLNINAITGHDATISSLAGGNTVTGTVGIVNGSSGKHVIISNGLGEAFSGGIETSAGITIAGGTQVFTGNLSFTGGAYITGGVLQLGDGGLTGSLSQDVTMQPGGKLVFNRSDIYKFKNQITGGGQVL